MLGGVCLFQGADLFVNNELHYNIPFWVGATVIVLLLLSAIVATIRYCIFSLCSSSSGKFIIAAFFVSPSYYIMIEKTGEISKQTTSSFIGKTDEEAPFAMTLPPFIRTSLCTPDEDSRVQLVRCRNERANKEILN